MIHNIIDMFIEVFKHLQVKISLKKIEKLAIMIHKGMTGPARSYHTLDHVLTLSSSSDPLQSLAALFHDIVYYQVDRGFPTEIVKIISPYIQEKKGKVLITKEIKPDDRPFMLTLSVFGYEAGQKLSLSAGLNEFLSALVMNTVLGGMLPEKALVKITACIEATIPFRGNNARGESFADLLEKRLRTMTNIYNFTMTFEEIEAAIKRAVVFSNNDVGSFAEQDVGKFLDDTWKLLPETNIALRSGVMYSIIEYRQALQKVERFLGLLNPDNIFHRYKDVPPEDEFQYMVTLAYTNIYVAHEYLGIKLLAIAILEALAEMTGGDAPLSLFMGDIRKKGEDVKRLEDFLPIDLSNTIDRSSSVVTLLNSGRASEISFDMRSSPTSFFLYKNLGPANIKQLLDHARDMFDGKLSAQEFLDRIDRPVVSAIAKASASMVVTRGKELLQYTLPECS